MYTQQNIFFQMKYFRMKYVPTINGTIHLQTQYCYSCVMNIHVYLGWTKPVYSVLNSLLVFPMYVHVLVYVTFHINLLQLVGVGWGGGRWVFGWYMYLSQDMLIQQQQSFYMSSYPLVETGDHSCVCISHIVHMLYTAHTTSPYMVRNLNGNSIGKFSGSITNHRSSIFSTHQGQGLQYYFSYKEIYLY